MAPIKLLRVEDLPEQTAVAAYELVSKLIRERHFSVGIELSLTDEGDPVGRYRVSVRQITWD